MRLKTHTHKKSTVCNERSYMFFLGQITPKFCLHIPSDCQVQTFCRSLLLFSQKHVLTVRTEATVNLQKQAIKNCLQFPRRKSQEHFNWQIATFNSISPDTFSK